MGGILPLFHKAPWRKFFEEDAALRPFIHFLIYLNVFIFLSSPVCDIMARQHAIKLDFTSFLVRRCCQSLITTGRERMFS